MVTTAQKPSTASPWMSCQTRAVVCLAGNVTYYSFFQFGSSFCNLLRVIIDQGTRCEEYDCAVPYSKGVQCSEDHLKYETTSLREKNREKKLRKRKNREKENQPPLRCQAQPASLRKNLWPIRWSWFCHRTERKTTTLSIFQVHSNIQISRLADDLLSGCQIKNRKNCKYCFLSQSGIEKVYKATQKTVAPKKTTSNFDFVKKRNISSPPEDDAGGGKQRREEKVRMLMWKSVWSSPFTNLIPIL